MAAPRIVFAAAEISPLAKTGGLGDVVGSLPTALQPYCHTITVALPFHEEIPRQQLKQLKCLDRFELVVNHKPITVTVWQARTIHSTVPLLLFKQDTYLSRGKVYDGLSVLNPLTGKLATKDSLGQRLKYLFFSYALHAYLRRHPRAFTIVHGHDFHVAPALALVHTDPALQHMRTVITIHNLRYTGSLLPHYWKLFQPSLIPLFDLTEAKRLYGPRMLWLGLRWADAITTVSPQYAKEILTPQYGGDFAALLQQRRQNLFGIINGIDTAQFNPATDPNVRHHFSWRTIQRRADNKLLLQRECGLPVDPTIPLVGMVARLTVQKGFHLVINAMKQLSALPIQLVICGTGRTEFMRGLHTAMQRYPKQWYFHDAFDTVFSQHVYAGSDIFLMPSRHEPCGLAQLIAMRYGSVPVVRSTGGLKDTVTEGDNGFLFNRYASTTMLAGVQRAVKVYQTQPKQWQQLMRHGMTADYTWKASAKLYSDLYKRVLRSAN
ncbi:MAG: glycogen synthase [Candidatus Kerfeldbacteria bacterium]|nr:glycogen synthase [Candidatus Kerfeldbacteria bacterium]